MTQPQLTPTAVGIASLPVMGSRLPEGLFDIVFRTYFPDEFAKPTLHDLLCKCLREGIFSMRLSYPFLTDDDTFYLESLSAAVPEFITCMGDDMAHVVAQEDLAQEVLEFLESGQAVTDKSQNESWREALQARREEIRQERTALEDFTDPMKEGEVQIPLDAGQRYALAVRRFGLVTHLADILHSLQSAQQSDDNGFGYHVDQLQKELFALMPVAKPIPAGCGMGNAQYVQPVPEKIQTARFKVFVNAFCNHLFTSPDHQGVQLYC